MVEESIYLTLPSVEKLGKIYLGFVFCFFFLILLFSRKIRSVSSSKTKQTKNRLDSTIIGRDIGIDKDLLSWRSPDSYTNFRKSDNEADHLKDDVL